MPIVEVARVSNTRTGVNGVNCPRLPASYGTLADFTNFVRLAYSTPHLHHSGGTVCEPTDLPVNKRHLEMVRQSIRCIYFMDCLKKINTIHF